MNIKRIQNFSDIKKEVAPKFKAFDVNPAAGAYYWELHHTHTPFWVDFYATIKPTDKACGQERFKKKVSFN